MPEPEPNPPQPRPTLRELLAENPAARRRLGRAYAEFLAVILVAIVSLTALVLWHLARRGRIIRQRLGQPRPLDWPRELHPPPSDEDDHDAADRDRNEIP